MTPSPTRPPAAAKFPVEIITEEEMSLIEDAFSSAAPPSVRFDRNVRSISSISRLAKRRLSGCTELGDLDMEDSGRVVGSDSPKRKSRVLESFLHRFRIRRGRGLSVTDITSTEWCEKKMEFCLLLGRPKRTEAMKAGCARHVQLEEEVVKRMKIDLESTEDIWAVKFVNFISGVNQLLFDGLTRELPVVGFAEGVWMVGIIDEIQMSMVESERIPILIDTKTRVRATLPAEPQRRNGRLQLMCYKHLWDSLVTNKFPAQKFFDYFSLNPHYILSPEVRRVTEKSGFPSEAVFLIKASKAKQHLFFNCIEPWGARTSSRKASLCIPPYYTYYERVLHDHADKTCLTFFLADSNLSLYFQTLDDLVRYFQNSCCLLPQAKDQLLLRYELQEDQSLLGEDKFDYAPEWFEKQINSCLEVWRGEREAICTPTKERWKCKFCEFSSRCPANSNNDDSTASPENQDILSLEI
ncbi:exonuclease V, chloroplastic [Dorcoceras hygrometricum]|uniref:Exonuclease V, chloroplastic n=1 Tax=Dorcoceras hygrometricum TaxID=472368 RepID=A0A2Z7CS82_9LAMI|nr:exonuclease V, chloroplastic [Dorcoceras hygrometricum]